MDNRFGGGRLVRVLADINGTAVVGKLLVRGVVVYLGDIACIMRAVPIPDMPPGARLIRSILRPKAILRIASRISNWLDLSEDMSFLKE